MREWVRKALKRAIELFLPGSQGLGSQRSE